jgi:hypothetical protein
MSWAELFERAEPYDVDVARVREQLATQRKNRAK